MAKNMTVLSHEAGILCSNHMQILFSW